MRFRLYEDRAGEFRWQLVAANGRLVADSGEGYATKSNARRAVRQVKRLIYQAAITEV